MGNVKLKDIAEALNVSTVTVSNALAGRKGVSEEVRSQVVAKAKELGYDLKNMTTLLPYSSHLAMDFPTPTSSGLIIP